MFALNVNLLNRPVMQVGNTRQKYNEEGNLMDNTIKELLMQLKDILINAIATVPKS
jgi:chromate reductase, NAD(P)H dehydrogenase (quinone)